MAVLVKLRQSSVVRPVRVHIVPDKAAKPAAAVVYKVGFAQAAGPIPTDVRALLVANPCAGDPAAPCAEKYAGVYRTPSYKRVSGQIDCLKRSQRGVQLSQDHVVGSFPDESRGRIIVHSKPHVVACRAVHRRLGCIAVHRLAASRWCNVYTPFAVVGSPKSNSRASARNPFLNR